MHGWKENDHPNAWMADRMLCDTIQPADLPARRMRTYFLRDRSPGTHRQALGVTRIVGESRLREEHVRLTMHSAAWCCLLVLAWGRAGAAAPGRADELVQRVNLMPSAGWTAQVFKDSATLSASAIKASYLGVLSVPEATYTQPASPTDTSLPSDFDWRTANDSVADCIGSINNQLKCGSCWAVSSVETFGDRRCLALRKQGFREPRVAFSALDLVACDKMCKFITRCCRGCAGGYPSLAWKFIQEKGVVTDRCMPYNLTKQLLCPVPKCFGPRAQQRVYKVKKYSKIYGGAPSIEKELLTSGPVQATFTVYEDFMHYHSGVYKHVTGKELGLHAVKIVGYGRDTNGTKYWSVANSWGTTWGNEGYFKIAVGECGFELNVYTATPCTTNSTFGCEF